VWPSKAEILGVGFQKTIPGVNGLTQPSNSGSFDATHRPEKLFMVNILHISKTWLFCLLLKWHYEIEGRPKMDKPSGICLWQEVLN